MRISWQVGHLWVAHSSAVEWLGILSLQSLKLWWGAKLLHVLK